MSNYGPRIPLHWQKNGIEKAIKKNPSYESARSNVAVLNKHRFYIHIKILD